jgi:hypothetical protein
VAFGFLGKPSFSGFHPSNLSSKSDVDSPWLALSATFSFDDVPYVFFAVLGGISDFTSQVVVDAVSQADRSGKAQEQTQSCGEEQKKPMRTIPITAMKVPSPSEGTDRHSVRQSKIRVGHAHSTRVEPMAMVPHIRFSVLVVAAAVMAAVAAACLGGRIGFQSSPHFPFAAFSFSFDVISVFARAVIPTGDNRRRAIPIVVCTARTVVRTLTDCRRACLGGHVSFQSSPRLFFAVSSFSLGVALVFARAVIPTGDNRRRAIPFVVCTARTVVRMLTNCRRAVAVFVFPVFKSSPLAFLAAFSASVVALDLLGLFCSSLLT